MTDTETKLEWIRGAVTHLDANPASPRVGTLTMGVLDYLINKTQSKFHLFKFLIEFCACRYDKDESDLWDVCGVGKDDAEHADRCTQCQLFSLSHFIQSCAVRS